MVEMDRRSFLILIGGPGWAFAAGNWSLTEALTKLERRYNNIRSMRVEFEQSLSHLAQSAPKRTESGVLYLRKPARMRWEYRQPARKLFLCDGKDIYFYSPQANRVERSKLKESDDMRAPLAFLIGKLDFNRDFREYRVRAEGPNRWITALPRSDKAAYERVEFLLGGNFEILRLNVFGYDKSVMEFVFRNETLNPPLDDNLFRFQMPDGAELVEISQ